MKKMVLIQSFHARSSTAKGHQRFSIILWPQEWETQKTVPTKKIIIVIKIQQNDI